MPQEIYETTENANVEGNSILNEDFWPDFNNTSMITENDYVECTGPENLAADVLRTFGISCSTPSIGGNITDLDIKRMDARTVINMSLIHHSATANNGYFYEAMAAPDGQVEFVPIGGRSGNITDMYYTVQTGQYKDDIKAVMVTGGQPLVTRRPMSWSPVWGTSPTKIYSMRDMLDNCHKEAFSRYATIVFKDPHLETKYEDGVDNLYEIDSSNPWDSVFGYVIYKEPPTDLVTEDTKITYATQTDIPIIIGEGQGTENGPYMGNLQDTNTYQTDIYNAECYTGLGDTVNASDGVRVDIPSDLRFTNIRGITTDLFRGISGVFVVGLQIDLARAIPRDDSSSIQQMTPENSSLMISISTARKTSVKLNEGRDYAVAYADEGGQKIPYIVFAKDIRPNDKYPYGHNVEYFINPLCEYARVIGGDFTQSRTGTIFPHSKTKGILVTEIWVYANVETPCVVIEDPNGTTGDGLPRCLEIAQRLKYYLGPIVIEEKPAPVGYKGPGLTGPLELKPLHDNDPTTVEDFSLTEYEQAMDNMQGGGMAVTYSFIKDNDYESARTAVQNMAEILYDHMNSSVTETIYTCGPGCNPQLGGVGNSNGVVNSIRYSYSDQGSYTVSVTEGPYLVGGLSPVDGGPTAKMTEDMSATGTVIDSVGDNMTFKVRIDGFADRWAISMTHDIIRVGDKVQVTVHNCPIEQ